MAVSTFASGTQSSSVGTEHFVSSPDVAGDFVFYADLSAMQAADVVELRVYKMAKAGGTSRQLYYGRFEGAQIGDVIAQSLPVANALTNTNAVRFSIKQTFGTTRDFDWSVKNREDFTAAPADSAGVTTLLGKFTGITVLAQWLGLIAGKQVGNSTARTEVRATGAGSGTFDETTDSVEALRDSALTAAQVNAEADTALADAGVTSTRMGYLTGAVALEASVQSIITTLASMVAATATAVWAAGTRTLTAFGFHVQLATTQDQYAPAKAGDAMTLTSAYDPAKTAATQTSVDDLPTNAELAIALAAADDAMLTALAAAKTVIDLIDAKTTNLPSDPADQSLIIAATASLASAIAALNNLSSSDVTTAVPTAEQNADALLGRSIAGGSDGGRDVTSALRAIRNRVVIDGNTITVYDETDTGTPVWTGTVTRADLDALQEINPA